MQLKEYIINTALIGTDKKSLSVNELPEQLRSSATKLFEKSEDSESLFLKTAALALNYYRGGIEPIKLNLNVEKAEDETGPYCSDSATAVLKRYFRREVLFACMVLDKMLCRKKSDCASPSPSQIFRVGSKHQKNNH
jgi:hypothetical protein